MAEPLDYVAVKDCGCVVGWAHHEIRTKDPKELAKTLSRWMKHGLDIQRMTTSEAKSKFGCDCGEKQRVLL